MISGEKMLISVELRRVCQQKCVPEDLYFFGSSLGKVHLRQVLLL